MKRDAAIREKISKKVYEECGKKVRSVFYLTDDGEKSYYCICGNNNVIFGVAAMNEKGDVEVVL